LFLVVANDSTSAVLGSSTETGYNGEQHEAGPDHHVFAKVSQQ
jgi:hypothetical protein